MTVPNALILTPLRFTSTSQVIRVTANSVTTDLTITVVVGRDYWLSGDGTADGVGNVNGEGDFLALVATALDTHAELSSSSVTIDSEYRVVITTTSTASVALEWSHVNTTLDPTFLGFVASDVTDASAPFQITSPNIPQGLWAPAMPLGVDGRDRQPITGGVARTVSGLPRVSRIATPLPERTLMMDLINQSKILDEYVASSDPYGSFEYNWINSISLGRNFRLYEDEADRTTGATFSVYQTRTLTDPLERAQQFNVLWSATLGVVLIEAV